MEEFLTVAEVAELLKLNPQTVRNWIDRGELSAVRAGSRRVRIRRTDLDRFLDSAPKPSASNAARNLAHFAVVTYSGREPEGIFGPFETEQGAEDWCRAEAIKVGSSPRSDGRRRGVVLAFWPR